jgi:carboxylesterase type B
MKISLGIQATHLLSIALTILAQGDGLTVTTQEGSVSGRLVTPGVRQFLGIPYATAKRWQAPQPASHRSSLLNATSFGDSCPQSLTANFDEVLLLTGAGLQNGVRQSENCQSLNIWAPSVDRKQGAAVMVWIYGGSFAFGSVR